MNIGSAEMIHLEISAMVNNGVSYIDAIVEYAKIRGLEMDIIAEVVKKSSVLTEHIRQEAIKNRMLKGQELEKGLDEFFE